MTLFIALKYSRHIVCMRMQECTFYEGGFMTLKDLIRVNQGIRKIEIRDMIQMGMNTHDSDLAVRNFIHVISALADNNFITEAIFSIYHNSACLFPPIFIGQALQCTFNDLIRNNSTLKYLKIEGFRIGGSEISSIFSALRYNKSLETLILTENLVEWKDLKSIINSLSQSALVKHVDLTGNQIHPYSEIKNLKGVSYANENLPLIQDVFKEIHKITLSKLQIATWFWEIRKYPDELHQIINDAKNQLSHLL